MTVTEIHFNHDPGSAKNDAINLRLNAAAGSEVTAPEWVDGMVESNPVAYAAGEISGPVTIKVRFKGGPPGEDLEIRAVRPRDQAVRGATRVRQVLGDVRKRVVHFNNSGESALESFVLSRDLSSAKVGIFQNVWAWQAFIHGDWQTFTTTHHKTHMLAAVPGPPWNQTMVPDFAWPWVDALNVACAWAFGASTAAEAAAAIATRINTHPLHDYNEQSNQFFTPSGQFNLTLYIWLVRNSAVSFIIDCEGIASALVTLANLLGENLMPLSLENQPGGGFSTKPIKPLSAPFTTKTWGHHEVAVAAALAAGSPIIAPAGATLLIYDANLQLDQAAPVLPILMPLGTTNGGDYRFKLIRANNADRATPASPRPVV